MSHHDTEVSLTPELLLQAYAAGIFPMAESRHANDVFWMKPKHRGILPIEGFHVPRRLRRTVRKGLFQVTCNLNFPEVVSKCAEFADERPDTWINQKIKNAVAELNKMGFAHSIECRLNGKIVGGLYGIAIGSAFFGESMFTRVPNASKVALVHLVARLKLGGYRLLDTQFLTDHLAQFGTVEISAQDYLELLEDALNYKATFPECNNDEEWRSALDGMISR